MISFNKSDLQRMAVSAIGAFTVSSACIFGAVGPARAEAPATVPAWQNVVEQRLPGIMARETSRLGDAEGQADVALHFDANGAFAGASLARSTGIPTLDHRAVAIARTLRYPNLPEAMRGRAQDVTLRLNFGVDPLARPAEAPTRRGPAGTEMASR